MGEVKRRWGREKGVRFPFLCACNKQQNTKVTPVSLVSALLSVKKDIIQMENGNCIINLDTQLHQHNNTALLVYFLTIYITCSEIYFEYKSTLVIVLLQSFFRSACARAVLSV